MCDSEESAWILALGVVGCLAIAAVATPFLLALFRGPRLRP